MADICVISERELTFQGKTYRCAVGKAGFTSNKQEGDNATPIGRFALRECWFRPDKFDTPPATGLPVRPIHKDDVWCDDPKSSEYNLHQKEPFMASHEKLWREDGRYDLIVPMGYNDDPPIAGKGSAIFWHIAADDYRGTEGCVALSMPDFLEILAQVDEKTHLCVQPGK